MKNLLKMNFFLCLVVILASCSQQTAPQGKSKTTEKTEDVTNALFKLYSINNDSKKYVDLRVSSTLQFERIDADSSRIVDGNIYGYHFDGLQNKTIHRGDTGVAINATNEILTVWFDRTSLSCTLNFKHDSKDDRYYLVTKKGKDGRKIVNYNGYDYAVTNGGDKVYLKAVVVNQTIKRPDNEIVPGVSIEQLKNASVSQPINTASVSSNNSSLQKPPPSQQKQPQSVPSKKDTTFQKPTQKQIVPHDTVPSGVSTPKDTSGKVQIIATSTANSITPVITKGVPSAKSYVFQVVDAGGTIIDQKVVNGSKSLPMKGKNGYKILPNTSYKVIAIPYTEKDGPAPQGKGSPMYLFQSDPFNITTKQ